MHRCLSEHRRCFFPGTNAIGINLAIIPSKYHRASLSRNHFRATSFIRFRETEIFFRKQITIARQFVDKVRLETGKRPRVSLSAHLRDKRRTLTPTPSPSRRDHGRSRGFDGFVTAIFSSLLSRGRLFLIGRPASRDLPAGTGREMKKIHSKRSTVSPRGC